MYKVLKSYPSYTRQKAPMQVVTLIPISSTGKLLPPKKVYDFNKTVQYKKDDLVDVSLTKSKRNYFCIDKIQIVK